MGKNFSIPCRSPGFSGDFLTDGARGAPQNDKVMKRIIYFQNRRVMIAFIIGYLFLAISSLDAHAWVAWGAPIYWVFRGGW